MSDIKLKPCPFCGNAEIRNYVEAYIDEKGKEVAVCDFWCPRCGASGPEKPHKVDAVNAWNERNADRTSVSITWKKSEDWVPISEKQPEVGQDAIYIKKGAKYARIGGYMGNGKWCNELGTIRDIPPITHWMPLPEPPQEN